jgi:hypothetical protein
MSKTPQDLSIEGEEEGERWRAAIRSAAEQETETASGDKEKI